MGIKPVWENAEEQPPHGSAVECLKTQTFLQSVGACVGMESGVGTGEGRTSKREDPRVIVSHFRTAKQAQGALGSVSQKSQSGQGKVILAYKHLYWLLWSEPDPKTVACYYDHLQSPRECYAL